MNSLRYDPAALKGKCKDMLSSVHTLILHPGAAHLDDLLCLFMAMLFCPGVEVHRRDPSPAELDDGDVLVCDVGQRHDPGSLCFDHHQDPEEDPSVAGRNAASLLISWLGLDYIFQALPWYQPSIVMDVAGPYQLADDMNIGYQSHIVPLSSPVEDAVLEELKNLTSMNLDYPEYGFYYRIASRWFENACVYADAKHGLDVTEIEIGGDGPAAGVRCLRVETELGGIKSAAMGDIAHNQYKGAAIVVSHDDRGDGLALLRLDDHPRVDFSQLKGDDRVLFCLPFIAKTKDRLDLGDMLEVLELSCKWPDHK